MRSLAQIVDHVPERLLVDIDGQRRGLLTQGAADRHSGLLGDRAEDVGQRLVVGVQRDEGGIRIGRLVYVGRLRGHGRSCEQQRRAKVS
jgi:hypothetical protein